MKYNPDKHHRRSIRIPDFDYSQTGWYFVTICVLDRKYFFGDVVDGRVKLNEYGNIVNNCWNSIPDHFPNVNLDEYIIMPNHVHGIINIFLNDDVGIQNVESLRVNKYQHIIPQSVGSIIRGFKTGVTKWFRNNTDIYIVWQKNYYERIIRNENELNKIRKYIVNNSANWETDKENI